MIKMVETKEEKETLVKLCSKSALGCKILGIIKAYGYDEKFSSFWIDTHSDSAFCLTDDVMIIAGTISDSEEVKGFIQAVGAREIMSAVRNSELLSFTEKESGEILKKEVFGSTNDELELDNLNIRDVAMLLDENDMLGDFEAFYLDLSHRLRHNTAIALTRYEKEPSELAGTLIVSAVTDTAAIISAIVVKDNYRRKGIGESLVKEVERYLSGKVVYIFKEKNKNNDFYKKLGYHKVDSWVTSIV